MDVAIWISAGLLALMVRFPRTLDDQQVWLPLLIVPVALVVVPAFRLPRAGWDRLEERDVERIALGIGAGTLILALLGAGLSGDGLVIPRSVVVLQGVLAFLGMVGLRLAVDRGDGVALGDPAPPP